MTNTWGDAATVRDKLAAAQALIVEATALLPTDAPLKPAPPLPTPTKGWVNPSVCGLQVTTAELKPQSALPTTMGTGDIIEGYALSAGWVPPVSGLTLRNCQIRGSSSMPAIYNRQMGVRLEHCDIAGAFPAACGFDHYTVLRCNVHHFSADGFKLGTDVHIVESWIHDATPGSGAHADGIQQETLIGPAWSSVERCYIDMGPALGNSALFLCPSLGGAGGGEVLVADNYLAGGNYTLSILDGNWGKYHQGTYRILRNTIKDGAWRYGPVQRNDVVAEWSANVLSTGAAV